MPHPASGPAAEATAVTRQTGLEALAAERWDLLVVGGGIVGAGILLDAVSRGLRAALVEQDDIAVGTSSRSSRLIHGGLRYLEHFQFHLVREALAERSVLLRLAPHLVRLEPFVFPVYGLPLLHRAFYGSGLVLYDVLGAARDGGRARHLDARATLKLVPQLRTKGLRGSVIYHDGVEDDARLALGVVRTALAHGGAAGTRLRATAPIRDGSGRICGVTVEDRRDGSVAEVRALRVVDATGVWAGRPDAALGGDSVPLVPSRGSHLIVARDRIPALMGMTLRVPGKVLFLVPWPDCWIIGTTDEPDAGPPSRPSATGHEVDAILDVVNATLEVGLRREDVLGTYTGLRPLVGDPGSGSTVKVSREHRVGTEPDGTVRVSGGKYTTYRLMARDAVDAALGPTDAKARPSTTHQLPLLGAADQASLDALPGQLEASSGLEARVAARLVARHGTEAQAIVELATGNDSCGRSARMFRSSRPRWCGPPARSWLSRSTTCCRGGCACPACCPTAVPPSRPASPSCWAPSWAGTRPVAPRRSATTSPAPTASSTYRRPSLRPARAAAPTKQPDRSGMSGRFVLALDQGTTSSRAILFDHSGQPVASAQRELPQHFPAPGEVEHDAEDIWEGQLATAREVLLRARVKPGEVAAIGLTNQRETTVVWERATGRPVARAVVWQSRVTAPRCEALRAAGHEERFRALTGLPLDAYFSGPKIAHILDSSPGLRERGEAGELCFGTIDSFLLWRLSGGRVHATDVSNASRTLLFDVQRLRWDEGLCELVGVPLAMLPEVRSSSEVYAESDPELLGAAIPIAGIAGDQQAAMFGQACLEPGMAKNTYGTGAFLLRNIGPQPTVSRHGLLTTVLWQLGPGGPVAYALEGSVFVAGAAVQWLRDGLHAIERSADVETLAAGGSRGDGVYVVPAFTGLGAPWWDPDARGLIIGLTRGTSLREIARATVDAIGYQVQDVLAAMESDAGERAWQVSAWMAAQPPMTPCCNSRPTCWTLQSSDRRSPRRPPPARPSWPASLPASGRVQTRSPRRGPSNGASSRPWAPSSASAC